MEVTKHNFKDALKEITTLLKDASFVSFDSEMSGLGWSFGDKNHDLDTPQERYWKASRRVKEYGLIQIGISVFRYCKTSKKFKSATYTFYLSGKLQGSYRYDTSSMMFLAENDFNFNKLFQEGLTFMALAEETEIRKKRDEKLLQEKDTNSPSPVKVKDEKSKAFMKSAMDKVRKSKDKRERALFPGKELNGFYRKILYSNVAPLFPFSHFKSLSGSERNIEVIHFESEEDKRRFMDDAWERDLSDQLGFTHVVKVLLEANKPLVGHNIIFDLLHFVDKFVSPLPDRLEDFKTLVTTSLPPVYDTKLIAKDPPFSAGIPNTSLGCLFDDLVSKYSPPPFDVENGCKSYRLAEKGQAHDAGFDAFMTAVCFVAMLKHVEGKNWSKKDLMKSRHLQNYINKLIFLGSYDIPCIDLCKPDTIPDRSYIYNVSCPSTWTSLNVRHTFGNLKAYKAVWVSDTHLYVIPQDEQDIGKAKKLLEDIQSTCSSNVKVTMYEDSKNCVSNGGGRPHNVVTFRSSKDDAAISKPSSIALKRSSDAKEAMDASSGGAQLADEPEASRNLKRLKSVGSEQLSNLTLESPMSVDEKLPPGSGKSKNSQSSLEPFEVFSVPDDW